ncbi:MAG: hypothetical protein HY521_05485 [Proteobacteria bacterium]|nr:hypothetical protein [Pseudomonadota bacterium]
MAGERIEREPGATDERARRVRGRNLALLAVLGGLAVLFYLVTIVKITGGG